MSRYPDFYIDPDFDFRLGDLEEFQMVMRLFWGIMLTVFIAALLIGVLYLVFQGLGLMRMAKRKGIPNGWMGFIPIASFYILGKVSATSERKRPEIALLVLSILSALFSIVCYLSIVPIVDIIFRGSLAAPRSGFDYEHFSGSLISVTALGTVTFLIAAGLSIALMVLMFIALHRIYKQFSPDSANVMTVFTVLSYTLLSIPIYPFMLFAIRNNEIWPMGKPPYGYQGPPYPPNIPRYDASAAGYQPQPYAPGNGQDAPPVPSLKPPAQGYASTHETSAPSYMEPLEPPAQGYATSIDPPAQSVNPPEEE